MSPLSLFATGVVRTAELNIRSLSRLCVVLGAATLLSGFDGRATQTSIAAVADIGDILSVILCCVGGALVCCRRGGDVGMGPALVLAGLIGAVVSASMADF
ncbi:MAG: hypothetical protein AAF684_10970, partial [Pseudomonadota bacterium]